MPCLCAKLGQVTIMAQVDQGEERGCMCAHILLKDLPALGQTAYVLSSAQWRGQGRGSTAGNTDEEEYRSSET